MTIIVRNFGDYRRRVIGSGLAAFAGRVGMAAVATVFAAQIASADTIEVGSIAALSGYLASYDGNFLDGLKLAVKTINAEKAAGPHQLSLHIMDGASNATTGVTATNQLLNQFGVSILLNGASSATSVAIYPIAAEASVPFICLSQLPPDHKWAFLSTTDFSRVMQLEIEFTTRHLKAKKIGIIYNLTPAAQKATQTLTELAPKSGLTVVTTQGVDVNATDFTPQMAAFKDAQVDAILDFMTGPAHILEAKAAATVGLKAPLVMGLDDTATFRQASASYPESYLSATAVQVFPDIGDPALKTAVGSFIDAHKKADLDPAGVQGAASGWDAAHVLAAAVKKSGAVGGEALRGAIEHLDYQGAVTRWQFTPDDHTGQAKSEALQIAKYSEGAMKVVFRPGGK
jgi:branched-chain amino acid transport system substrate-binding protein